MGGLAERGRGAHLIKSLDDAVRLLIEHQDGEVERGEFSDTLGERTEIRDIGLERDDCILRDVQLSTHAAWGC